MEARHRKNLKSMNAERLIFMNVMWFNLTDVRQNKIPFKNAIKPVATVNMRSHMQLLLDNYVNPV